MVAYCSLYIFVIYAVRGIIHGGNGFYKPFNCNIMLHRDVLSYYNLSDFFKNRSNFLDRFSATMIIQKM